MERNKKWSFKFMLCLLILISINLFNISVANAEPKEGGFSYKVDFPKNQLRKDIGFYHLKMKPSENQVVTIELNNPSKKETVIRVSLNGAKTNSNGVIEYGDNDIEKDASLAFDFNDVVKAPKKVTLKPGESQKLSITIKMPETEYDGVIAGGIQFIEENQEQKQASGGATVINEYAYVVGVLLQETDTKVKPKLKMNKVFASQANAKNNIVINYSNTEPVYVDDMTTEVQIMKKNQKGVLYERKQSKMRMAPNSNINFPVSMNGEKMEKGEYTAKILVTAKDGLREEWTKDFKIEKEEADKFNERDVGLVQEKDFDWKLIVIIITVFVVLTGLILSILMFIRKKNKSKKKSSTETSKQNKKRRKK